MKTVAITCWNTIVSPLYDSACFVMIDRGTPERQLVKIRALSLVERIRCCREERVEIVICGAISIAAFSLFVQNSIEVIPWVCGPVHDILTSYRNNENVACRFAMPGCRSNCQRRQRGQEHGKHTTDSR